MRAPTWIVLTLFSLTAVRVEAEESLKREYQLLQTMPPEIISTYLPDKLGTIIKGRGGCRYLAAAAVNNDKERADDAWKSVEAMFATQVEDGGFEGGGRPGDAPVTVYSIRVENAYFFLQEVGRAVLIVNASPLEPHFRDRFANMMPKLRKACDFIQKGYPTIVIKVGHTANRLLIAAKAFGLCGIVLGDEKMKESSRKLVKAALERRDKEGVFVERGGRDSSYNAVALLMAQQLTLYLPNEELEAAMKLAMDWQLTRIKPTGEIIVEGNTRTGVGKELSPDSGKPKDVNYSEVAQTLWYYGAIHNEPAVIDVALKVREWQLKRERGL
ncbi:hypothetical protein K2Y11_18480 [bacterium]|nr:hypothetical protein [bacterium]